MPFSSVFRRAGETVFAERLIMAAIETTRTICTCFLQYSMHGIYIESCLGFFIMLLACLLLLYMFCEFLHL